MPDRRRSRRGPAPVDPRTFTCTQCGRTTAWRASFEAAGGDVRYCSDACRDESRRERRSGRGTALEDAVRRVLAGRPRTSTACPSEVARLVAGGGGDAWRPLMEPVRRAARRLVASGEVEVLQHGAVVDPATARGPVRLRATDGLRRPAPGRAA